MLADSEKDTNPMPVFPKRGLDKLCRGVDVGKAESKVVDANDTEIIIVIEIGNNRV